MKRIKSITRLTLLASLGALLITTPFVNAHDRSAGWSRYPLRFTNAHEARVTDLLLVWIPVEGIGLRSIRVSLSGHVNTRGNHSYFIWTVNSATSLPPGSILRGKVEMQTSDNVWRKHPTGFEWRTGNYPRVESPMSIIELPNNTAYPKNIRLTFSAISGGGVSLPKTVSAELRP